MEYYGRGPLLSAKAHDLDVLWERARQMQAACEQVRACAAPFHPPLGTMVLSLTCSGGTVGLWEMCAPQQMGSECQNWSWLAETEYFLHGPAE